MDKIVSYNLASLPPREAWKEPDKWLGYVRPEDRIILPTDDRGLVQIDNAFDRVMDLFKPRYKWEFNPDDFRTVPDQHHYYYFKREWELWSERLGQSEDPFERENAQAVIEFRENPTNIGMMLRGIHNAIHHTTQKPELPALEHIVEYTTNYELARLAFSKITSAAEGIKKSTNLIALRENSVRQKPELVNNGETDAFCRQILEDKLNRRQAYLKQSIKEFLGVRNNGIIMPDGQEIRISETTPLETIIELGKRARNFAYRNQAINEVTPVA